MPTAIGPTDRQPSAVWLVLAAIVSVQVGAAFGKGLFGQVPPVSAAWLRLVTAGVVLLAVVRPWRAFPRRGEPDATRRWLVLAAFAVCLVGMNVAIYLSFAHIPIGVAVTIEFLGPLAVAVVGATRAVEWVWALLAAAGVVLLGFAPGSHLDAAGIALALLAGACWAGYIVVGPRLAGRWRGVDALGLACALGAVVLAPVAIPAAGAALWHPTVLVTGAAVGLLSTVVPYSLELVALRRLPRQLFGILMSLEPAAAALSGLLILRERLGWVDLVAMALVTIASVGSARTRRAAPPVGG